jgi:hypothetical protein
MMSSSSPDRVLKANNAALGTTARVRRTENQRVLASWSSSRFRSIFLSSSPLTRRQIAPTAAANNTMTASPTATVKNERRNAISAKPNRHLQRRQESMSEYFRKELTYGIAMG